MRSTIASPDDKPCVLAQVADPQPARCALSTTLKSHNTEADGIINTMINIDVQRLEP
jgi:hypothetical protein